MPKQVMALQKVSYYPAPLCTNANNSCLNQSLNQSNIYIIAEKQKYQPPRKGKGNTERAGEEAGGAR